MAIKASSQISITDVSDGNGIASTSITYQSGSSGTTPPTGVWEASPPATTAESPYMWTKTVITYTDGKSSTSYSVGSTPEGIQVGGRNLIVSNNVVNGYVNSSGVIYSTSLYRASDYIPVAPGDIITFQLWTPSSVQSWIDDTYFDSDKNYVTGYGGEYITSNHIIKTYIVPEGVAYVRMSYAWKTGYKVKLEKGNKATDWTPAPEDTEESINNVNTKAQGIIDNIYTPNTTTIDGGKITTGSIKAAQIDVNNLFAQNIKATGTITGATLKGTNAEITKGKVGDFTISSSLYSELTTGYLHGVSYTSDYNPSGHSTGVTTIGVSKYGVELNSQKGLSTYLTNGSSTNRLEYTPIGICCNGTPRLSIGSDGFTAIESELYVKNSIYTPGIYSNTYYFTPTQAQTNFDSVQLRFSGGTGSQGISFVTVKNNTVKAFHTLVHANGNAGFISINDSGVSANNIMVGSNPTAATSNYGVKLLTNGRIDCRVNGNEFLHFYRANNSAYLILKQTNSISSNIICSFPRSGNVTTSSSDKRLKENIKPSNVNALELINKLRPVSFDWKEDGYSSKKHWDLGFIADEMELIDKGLVQSGSDEEEDYRSPDLWYIEGYLIKAVQELSAEVNKLRVEINELKSNKQEE